MATRDLRSYFTNQKNKKKSQAGIPELFKATGNVTAADTSAVNTELKSFRKIKEYNTSIQYHLLVLKRK